MVVEVEVAVAVAKEGSSGGQTGTNKQTTREQTISKGLACEQFKPEPSWPKRRQTRFSSLLSPPPPLSSPGFGLLASKASGGSSSANGGQPRFNNGGWRDSRAHRLPLAWPQPKPQPQPPTWLPPTADLPVRQLPSNWHKQISNK